MRASRGCLELEGYHSIVGNVGDGLESRFVGLCCTYVVNIVLPTAMRHETDDCVPDNIQKVHRHDAECKRQVSKASKFER